MFYNFFRAIWLNHENVQNLETLLQSSFERILDLPNNINDKSI